MRILVVEDDFISSQVMQEILSSYGDVRLADNGEDALNIFNNAFESESRFDLILLDIMMPILNGQEVLQYIRQIEETYNIFGLDGVKIIMTTALDDFENISKAFNNQCDGYIVKPIDRAKLERILRDFNFLV